CGRVRDHALSLSPFSYQPGPGRVFSYLPFASPDNPSLFTPILRPPHAALWRLYACFTYPFSVNYTNGVDAVLHRLLQLIISMESI
ncbi:hypothetical protein, partial [Aeromonas salmonicida]|uniref:hypothetical protein n=1 Tax=Aeromonas salmonicida TaxID=645 RepID=UPI001C5FE5C1